MGDINDDSRNCMSNKKQFPRSFEINSDFSDPNDNNQSENDWQLDMSEERINQSDYDGYIYLNQFSKDDIQKILTQYFDILKEYLSQNKANPNLSDPIDKNQSQNDCQLYMNEESINWSDNNVQINFNQSSQFQNRNILNTQWTTQLQQYNRNQQQSYPIIDDEYIKECNDFLNQKQNFCRSFKSNSDFSDPNDNQMEQECEQPRWDQESLNQQDDNGQINLNQSSQFQNQKILTAQQTTQLQQSNPNQQQSQQKLQQIDWTNDISQQPENTNETNNSTNAQKETKKKAKIKNQKKAKKENKEQTKRGRPEHTDKTYLIYDDQKKNYCSTLLTRIKWLQQKEMKENQIIVSQLEKEKKVVPQSVQKQKEILESVDKFFQNNKRLVEVSLEKFNNKLTEDNEFRDYIFRAFMDKKDFFEKNLGKLKDQESYYKLLGRFDFYAFQIKFLRKILFW